MITSAKKWLGNHKIILTCLPVIISAVVASLITVGIRQGGGWQFLALSAYDRMLQLRPDSPPDSRLLTVLVTEEDIQNQGKWPLPDATLAKALTILENAQPRAIGLDLFRDLPVEPGHAQLSELFRHSDRLIGVCKLESAEFPSVGPPPSLALDQVGFADIPIDLDGVVRRNLYYMDPQESKCPTPYSFSLVLSIWYLLAEGIEPQVTESELLRLGKTTLKPITSNTGNYQNIDAGGYQVMLNYRAAKTPSATVTLGQLLNGEVDADLIKDKVVLLGVSAPSLKDSFYTPFSNETAQLKLMPGVVIHAQMVSQLLSAALDGQPLIWSWNQRQEIIWIFFWGFLGSMTVLLMSRPILMVSLQVAGLIVIIATSYVIFLYSGWIPLVSTLFSFLGGGVLLLLFNAYQARQEQLIVRKQVEQQGKSIALLRLLLSETQQQLEMGKTLSNIGHEKGSVLVGRYKIVRGLGKGSFGRTYLARDLQRPGKPYCVIKLLTPACQDAHFLEVARRLFKTEAKILERIGKHPQIPLLLAYIEQDNQFYLIQEYIKGQTLTQEFKKQGQYSEKEVLKIVKEILLILAFIQKYKLIHRDIKPDNIIRRASDRRLVLIDFGAVKQINPPHLNDDQNKTVVIGTEGYAPPEQLVGQPMMASDLYATGIMAICALTGIKANQLEKNSLGEVIWQPYANVSKPTAEIINKMISYHFSDRYQTAKQVLNDLRQLI